MQTEWQFPNAATPPGSANYYIARFAATPQRNTTAAWLAWFALIDGIAEKANDPGVARLKLDWWREEAKLMRHNQARHPLAQVLGEYVNAEWQTQQMHRALEAIEQRILKQTPTDQATFQQQCAQEHGSRLMLLANRTEAEIQNQAEWLGSYHAMVMRIQKLGKDLQRHYLSLPSGFLNEHGIRCHQLEARENLPGLVDVMAGLLDSLEQRLQGELPGLKQQAGLHGPLRMAVQAYYLSRRMRKKGYASHQHWFELTPLQNLWSAWRMG